MQGSSSVGRGLPRNLTAPSSMTGAAPRLGVPLSSVGQLPTSQTPTSTTTASSVSTPLAVLGSGLTSPFTAAGAANSSAAFPAAAAAAHNLPDPNASVSSRRVSDTSTAATLHTAGTTVTTVHGDQSSFATDLPRLRLALEAMPQRDVVDFALDIVRFADELRRIVLTPSGEYSSHTPAPTPGVSSYGHFAVPLVPFLNMPSRNMSGSELLGDPPMYAFGASVSSGAVPVVSASSMESARVVTPPSDVQTPPRLTSPVWLAQTTEPPQRSSSSLFAGSPNTPQQLRMAPTTPPLRAWMGADSSFASGALGTSLPTDSSPSPHRGVLPMPSALLVPQPPPREQNASLSMGSAASHPSPQAHQAHSQQHLFHVHQFQQPPSLHSTSPTTPSCSISAPPPAVTIFVAPPTSPAADVPRRPTLPKVRNVSFTIAGSAMLMTFPVAEAAALQQQEKSAAPSVAVSGHSSPASMTLTLPQHHHHQQHQQQQQTGPSLPSMPGHASAMACSLATPRFVPQQHCPAPLSAASGPKATVGNSGPALNDTTASGADSGLESISSAPHFPAPPPCDPNAPTPAGLTFEPAAASATVTDESDGGGGTTTAAAALLVPNPPTVGRPRQASLGDDSLVAALAAVHVARATNSAAASFDNETMAPASPATATPSPINEAPHFSATASADNLHGLIAASEGGVGETAGAPAFSPVTPRVSWPGQHAGVHNARAGGGGHHPLSRSESVASLAHCLPVKESTGAHVVTDHTGALELINDYAVLLPLGSGQFGKVVLAADPAGKAVAIKIVDGGLRVRASERWRPRLRSAPLDSQESAASVSSEVSPASTSVVPPNGDDAHALSDAGVGVLREIAIMKKMRHRNCIQLLEVIEDEEEETIYLVMQYAAGGSALRRHPDGSWDVLSEDLVRSRIADAARGLMYLHAHNVAHRDIKPDNIVVGEDGTAYLCDFGVSEVLSDRHRRPRTMQAGTIAFWSPELCTGHGSHAGDSHRFATMCDVWALGVTMFVMLTGKYPFGRPGVDQAHQIIRAICRDEPTYPETMSANAREALEGCLAKDTEKRWSLRRFRSCAFLREGQLALTISLARDETEADAALASTASPTAALSPFAARRLRDALESSSAVALAAAPATPPKAAETASVAESGAAATVVVDPVAALEQALRRQQEEGADQESREHQQDQQQKRPPFVPRLGTPATPPAASPTAEAPRPVVPVNGSSNVGTTTSDAGEVASATQQPQHQQDEQQPPPSSQTSSPVASADATAAAAIAAAARRFSVSDEPEAIAVSDGDVRTAVLRRPIQRLSRARLGALTAAAPPAAAEAAFGSNANGAVRSGASPSGGSGVSGGAGGGAPHAGFGASNSMGRFGGVDGTAARVYQMLDERIAEALRRLPHGTGHSGLFQVANGSLVSMRSSLIGWTPPPRPVMKLSSATEVPLHGAAGTGGVVFAGVALQNGSAGAAESAANHRVSPRLRPNVSFTPATDFSAPSNDCRLPEPPTAPEALRSEATTAHT